MKSGIKILDRIHRTLYLPSQEDGGTPSDGARTMSEDRIGRDVMEAVSRAGLTVASPDMGYEGFSFDVVQQGTVYRVTVKEQDDDAE